jgi:predicted protein tyrosine phosphatase
MQGDAPKSVKTPFPITVCGIQELPGHSARHVSHVLSIVDPDHGSLDAFGDYGEHARLELRFHDVIEDSPGIEPPQPHHVEQVLSFGREVLRDAAAVRHLLVHCHMGVSRSTASMALILAQAQPDLSARNVLHQVLAIRQQAWPNLRILGMGEEMLGRKGEFTDVVGEIYALQIERKPEMQTLFTEYGRAREVEAAQAFMAKR